MDEPNKPTDPIAAACDNEVNNILNEEETANEGKSGERTDAAPDNTDVESEEINLKDIEELAEAINSIHDKVTVIENDQTNFIRNTQQRL